MTQYRFVTPHRVGKWYNDLVEAQRRAVQIGAGFLDRRSEEFQAYLGTRLEIRRSSIDPQGSATA